MNSPATLAPAPTTLWITPAEMPHAPNGALLWVRVLRFCWVFVGIWAWDQLSSLLMDYWLLDSLGYASVFWTNLKMMAGLFVAAYVVDLMTVAPALAPGVDRNLRQAIVHLGLMEGVITAWYFATNSYLEFLLIDGRPFNKVDPIFGIDIGWYFYTLPAIWSAWGLVLYGSCTALLSCIICSWARFRKEAVNRDMTTWARTVAIVSTPVTRVSLGTIGATIAVGWWLARYNLLTKNSEAKSIFSGASYVDVNGLFSTLHAYWVTGIVSLVSTIAVIRTLTKMHHAVRRPSGAEWKVSAKRTGWLIFGLILLDFAFMGAVGLRDTLLVRPNEPVIQIPYIQQHIESTREAYDLNRVETKTFIPKGEKDPVPDPEKLLQDPALRNAPLWPGFVSRLERLIDEQHALRAVQSGGDPMIYGTTLEIFRQQQKLRPYYDFMDVDTVRYMENGEQKMYVNAVREIPLVEPKPWLAWWGQRFVLFTHGYGLVMAGAGDVQPPGEPVYAASGIPVKATNPALAQVNQAVYYGEGAGSMAYSNVDRMKELDYPTDEGRAEVILPPDLKAGVKIDSILKRLVFGWKSGQFFEIVFSDLIKGDTRVHYFRTPIERAERIAPFLYYDTDPYAVAAQGGIQWIVNTMTWMDTYPYSRFDFLGDKSDERSPAPRPDRWMNYLRDSVKTVIDAYTGKVTFYRISDEPVVMSWVDVYPELFTSPERMPDDIRAQLTVPAQFFHTQFDDLYILYQMRDPMTFFNMEDMWDDGDEVMGPILDKGHAIRFSIEPYNWIAKTGTDLPATQSPTQFALSMVFTPENALNLRAILTTYQDGPDYGRTVALQVPKGLYFTGPEQAESTIDQDPEITKNFTWWTRMGCEVIRGHLTTLVVDGEVLYIEPVFIRSQQNPVTQLKRVGVVLRGKAAMEGTLAEAVRAVCKKLKDSGS